MQNHQDRLSVRFWFYLVIAITLMVMAFFQSGSARAGINPTIPSPTPLPTSITGALPISSLPFAGPLPAGAVARFGKGAVSRVLVPAKRDIFVVDTNLGIYTFDDNNELLFYIDQAALSISLSKDGKRLAVFVPNKITIFDAHTGHEIRIIPLDRLRLLNSLVFSPDGSLLAAGGDAASDSAGETDRRKHDDDNVVMLWNVSDGALIDSLNGHTEAVSSLAFSPDGALLASAAKDQTVKIWNVDKANLARTLQVNHYTDLIDAIDTLAFSHDGARLAAAPLNGPISIWQTGKWNQTYTLDGNTFGFTTDGKKIVSIMADELTFWDYQTRKALSTVVVQGEILNLSPDGSTLSIRSPEGIVILDLEDEAHIRDIRTITGFLGRTRMLAFAPTGKILAVGCEDQIYAVDPGDGALMKSIAGDFAGFDADGNILSRLQTSAGSDLINTANGQEVASFDPGYANIVASDVSGRILAVITAEGITFWDSANSAQSHITSLSPQERISALALSPDGKLFAYALDQEGADEYPIYLLDVQTGKKSRLFSLPDPAAGLAFSPDKRTLAYSGYNQPIVFWDLQTKKAARTLAHTNGNLGLSFSADGKKFAYSAYDTIWLLETQSGTPITKFRGHAMSVDRTTFSPDGKMLVSGSRDGTLLLWMIP